MHETLLSNKREASDTHKTTGLDLKGIMLREKDYRGGKVFLYP